ncbi:hypothetical protein AGMMS50239_34920 [Bacteroidia bacterium]|nr:hypothetical protein FACS1894207_2460 [Bacteroidia bacterium]GHT68934.1 hypothetical protein AGMMS50239_34920 [Bacteroidia bacterium]
MNHENSHAYDKTFKQFILGILYFVAMSTVYAIYSYSPLPYPFNYILFLEVVIHIISIVLVHVVPIVYIKKLVRLYFILLFVVLFPTTIFDLSVGVVALLFWYIATPICIYVIYPGKKAAKWIGYGFLLVVLTIILSQVLRHYYASILYRDIYPNFNTTSAYNMLTANIISAFSAFLLVCYSLYYMHRFHRIQISQLMDTIGLVNDEKEKYLLNAENEEEKKYRQIYARIMEYFTTKQPYLQEKFSLTQMAHDLNINPAYLSKAINSKENMNFNSLVNFYRIEKVKELMQQEDSQKYTLKYIYLSSGFKNQSSFNKAFKMQEGITPSEYFKQYVKNSNDVDEKT